MRGTPARVLTPAVQALSRRYREDHDPAAGVPLRSDLEVAAYLVSRLPATYAAVAAVFRETRARLPDLAPVSLLDLGGGPGTAAWAATATWPSLREITVLDGDARMLRAGQALADHAGAAALRRIRWHRTDVRAPWPAEPADITVAAYVLGELPDAVRGTFCRRVWEHTREVGVIVEPGTPRGWRLVREAGDELTGAGAEMAAPFPWTWRCVESERDWCHFAERVPRGHRHRVSKGAERAYEDEKYTYLAVSRRPGTPIAARVMRHPQVRTGHIRLVLCTPGGIMRVVVTRSDRDAFHRAKHLRWGDAIPLSEDRLEGADGSQYPHGAKETGSRSTAI